MNQASLSITNSQSSPKLMFIESVMPSNHLILCCPLSSCPQSFPIRIFSNESVLHIRRPKNWSFSFSISSSNEHSGLISFKMDWLDLILCCPLLLKISNIPSIRVFSSEFVLHIRWRKYWSVSFRISPSNEYSGLISFRIYRLALLAVQESSPTPQFKSMNSFTFSLLYRPTHIHTWLLEKPQPWLDGPCWQSTISAF